MPQTPPVDPCPDCRLREDCRLPLNCGRYLAYKRSCQQYEEDVKALRQIRITEPWLPTKTASDAWKKAAQDCPWKPGKEEDMGTPNKLDQEPVRELYEEGLNDSEIAMRFGTTKSAICQWRKRNGLPANIKKNNIKEDKPMENNIFDQALLRIQAVAALYRPEDALPIKVAFRELVGCMVADAFDAIDAGSNEKAVTDE